MPGQLFSDHFNRIAYTGIMDQMAVAVYVCDTSGHITYYNQAAAELWGRSPKLNEERWSGAWKIYRTDGSELPNESCPMALTLKEGRPAGDEEMIIERPDHTRRIVQPNVKPVFDEHGQLTCVISTLVDVTKKKESEQAVVESENKYYQLVQGIPSAAYMCDQNGRFILFNKAATELWGREPDADDLWCGGWKAYSTDGRELTHEEAPLSVAIRENKFMRGKEYVIERPDGSRRFVVPYPQPVYGPTGEIIAAVNMLDDVTEQRQVEQALRDSEHQYRELADQLEKKVNERTLVLYRKNEELRRSEERYHKMIEEVQDYAITLLDKDGIILNWNQGATRIKGYEEKEIVGKSFRVFYSLEDRAAKLPERLISQASETGRATHEGWRRKKDGSYFWGFVTITALHNEENEIIGFSKVTRDLTERKMAEDTMKLYTSELEFQNKELEQFAYITSHDLQEPLRKIQIFSERLENAMDKPAQAKEYLGKIRASASRMSLLIKDVLNYTRLHKNSDLFEDVNLNEVIEKVKEDLELVIAQKHATISYNGLPVVKGIPVQLYQLFLNIINNSLKFSEKNPVIDIRAEELTDEQMALLQLADMHKKYVKITCTDNGIGFDSQYAERIFKLFQRLNDGKDGSGIGLALCKKIAENHHGSISATSVPGEGTVVTIYFPVPHDTSGEVCL